MPVARQVANTVVVNLVEPMVTSWMAASVVGTMRAIVVGPLAALTNMATTREQLRLIVVPALLHGQNDMPLVVGELLVLGHTTLPVVARKSRTLRGLQLYLLWRSRCR